MLSLPTWERGLKYRICTFPVVCDFVAPYMGAWIEITVGMTEIFDILASLPTWERGLK